MSTPVIMIEDNPRVAEHVRGVLEASPDYELAAWFQSGRSALEGLGRRPVRIVILDLGLPDLYGLDLIPGIRAHSPDALIVAYTVFEDEETILRAIEAGTNGYLLKDTPADLLLAELRVMELGGAPMTARIARTLLRRSFPKSAAKANAKKKVAGPAACVAGDYDRSGPTVFAELSDREREVLNLVALGLTYRDAAEELDISEHTLRRHIENIYRKLNVHKKSEAIVRGRR
ncbi:MAG: response regulator transcription factor, partial [Leptospirales bacterium]